MTRLDSIEALKLALEDAQKINQLYAEQLKTATLEIKELQEIVSLLKKNLYGRSTEKAIPNNQLSLFEPEPAPEPPLPKPKVQVVVVKTHQRKKLSGRKKLILDQYPQRDIHHTLSEAEQVCQGCSHSLTDIGVTLTRRELEFVPAVLRCVNHYQHTYKCSGCSDNELTDQLTKPAVPKAPLTNSFGSASLIAETIYQKYLLKVPAYRQVQHWKRLQLPLTDSTICQWHIKVCEYYLKPIYDALHHELTSQAVAHIDETTFNVIKSERQRTYYWVFQSSKQIDRQIVYFAHRPGRSREDFLSVVGDFKGYLHSDMYAVYQKLNEANVGIKVAGCWAHLRRKFHEALVPDPTSEALPNQILKEINELFELERGWQSLSIEERLSKRQKTLKPKINHLYWKLSRYNKNLVHKGGLFYKAISYALNHKELFYTFLEDGRLEMSNNAAERSIKTLVIGRKNQLFTTSIAGAEAGGILLTLIETAKRHQLEPQAYLTYLLTHLPNEPDSLHFKRERYLPWSDEVQAACRQKQINLPTN